MSLIQKAQAPLNFKTLTVPEVPTAGLASSCPKNLILPQKTHDFQVGILRQGAVLNFCPGGVFMLPVDPATAHKADHLVTYDFSRCLFRAKCYSANVMSFGWNAMRCNTTTYTRKIITTAGYETGSRLPSVRQTPLRPFHAVRRCLCLNLQKKTMNKQCLNCLNRFF